MSSSPISANRGSAARSPGGLLTAWLGAWLTGRTAADNLLAAVQGPDLPHTVDGLPDEGDGAPLARMLGHVRSCGPARVELRLPVPGDPDGLPAGILAAASEA